ncbi:MAG: PhoH family protein [Planctomycetota bacterium]|nr:PhoH family protein [Planctomycetota bacterium]
MNTSVPLHSLEEEQALCGPQDTYARSIRNRFAVTWSVRGGRLHLGGEQEAVEEAVRLVRDLLNCIRGSEDGIDEQAFAQLVEGPPPLSTEGVVPARHSLPQGTELRSKGQERYVASMMKETITFVIGPAGTGKTYLAAAVAVAALRRGEYRKLVLVRPAVEAGEHLGFLPGDLVEKVNPYLRPLYDALQVHLEAGKLKHFLENDVIEIAPLAYMRGRTLDHAFIILDEGQNTTQGQMKMFLTRMGEGSRIVVTGDDTQVDLPSSQVSGLSEAATMLKNVPGIGVVNLDRKDVVRHPLLEKVVNVYSQRERNGSHRKQP